MRSIYIAAIVCLAGLGGLEARRIVNEDNVGNNRTTFICPDACQECCIDKTWFGFAQRDDFKCIAKAPYSSLDEGTLNKLFAGRVIDPPEKRTYAPEQAKLDVEYTKEEIDGSAWRDLDRDCSKYSKCCCAKAEDWTEDKCFPMDASASHIFGESSRGSTEKYMRLDQIYRNTGKCVDHQNVAQMYQASYDSPVTDRGCCISTETRTASIKYVCGCSATSRGCSESCSTDSETGQESCSCWGHGCSTHPSYCSFEVYWTACTEWEYLYHCSDDQGVTQSGQRYRRISNETGMCLGDQSNLQRLAHTYGFDRMQKAQHALKHGALRLKDGKCPEDYQSTVAGLSCKCDVACGDGW